jgi:pyroglutamyl-peptidase
MFSEPTPAPMRILLTGFEPFGGHSRNPSWEVARALHGQTLQGAQIVAVQLPCVFAQALAALQQALTQHQPDIALALGQADGRCDFSVERVAINLMDARIPDNAGAQPVDVPVVAGGPAAYFSTLPIKALVAGLRCAGFAASVSQTAGTFVCNQVFYALQHTLSGRGVHTLCICRCCPNRRRTDWVRICRAGPCHCRWRPPSTPWPCCWRTGVKAWPIWPLVAAR